MQLLITGASGFVGHILSPYLMQFHNSVRPISLRDQWRRNDISEADCIIHLAGKAHDTSNTSFPEEYFSINTVLTKRLFDRFLDGPTKIFIYFSSVKAVADSVNGVLDENAVPSPRTPYGLSKLRAEEYILSQKLSADKRVFVLRPTMIHGPGNRGNLNLLYNIVERGFPWPLAAFENQRSFLSIDNLCYIVKLIIEAPPEVPSGIYNCADDESLPTNELVALIAESIGKKPKFWRIPKQIIKRIATMGDTFNLPMDSERLGKLTENYVVSNKKLKSVLGIEKLPFSAREGLQKTFKSFAN